MQTAGHGDYGCYFFLRDPDDRKLLPDTRYIVKVFFSPEAREDDHLPLFEFEGKTDAVARTNFIRTPIPITPQNMVFVQKIGLGDYGRIPRLVRGSDGEAVAGARYTVTWCNGTYSGVTDELGNGALISSEQSCSINVAFHAPK